MRVNIVPPSELTDQHLRAEHLELTLVADAFRRTLASASGFVPKKVPSRYTLNTGHVYFFYNKGLYLHRRFDLLTKEIHARGFRASLKFPFDIWPTHLYNDWTPEDGDFAVIRARIGERVMRKPYWYRQRSKHLTEEQIEQHRHNAVRDGRIHFATHGFTLFN